MKGYMKRIITLLILILFGFVIIGSSCFIIMKADHDCTGDGCSVCYELTQCHKMINTLGTAVAGALKLSLLLCIITVSCRVIIRSRPAHNTLISLKVELLD